MPCARSAPAVGGDRRQGRLEAIEVFLAGSDRPGNQLVLRYTRDHVGIAIADSVERAVHVVIRHTQEERPTIARIERAGGDERSALLEPLEVGAVLLLDGEHDFKWPSVPDERDRVHECVGVERGS